MKTLCRFTLLLALLPISALLLPWHHATQAPLTLSSTDTNDFDLWLTQQKKISFSHIIDNVGGVSPVLSREEVPAGVVIASPSKSHPDYFYQWIRDSALTIRLLVYHLDDSGFAEPAISNVIEDYINNNFNLQRTNNWSGTLNETVSDYSGLGEPKFHVDMSTFDAKWGRPQRDGPGLRVSTIACYLYTLERHHREPSHGSLPSRRHIYHHIIKPDLHYIMSSWPQTGFDLWEEVDSVHFFTSITQLRAIQDGVVLHALYDPEDEKFGASLEETFAQLKEFIESADRAGFKLLRLPYLIETPSLLTEKRRSGLDVASILGALHAHSLETTDMYKRYQSVPFDVDDSHVLNSLEAIVADMKYRYPVNRYKAGWGVGVGRYPEDVYDGYGTLEGNPWFISTATVAEVLYRMVYKWNQYHEDLVVSKDLRKFYLRFIDLVGSEDDDYVVAYGSEEHHKLSLNLIDYADSFLQVIKDHVDVTGRLSEQFNKYLGYMQGAENLTWSYSAVWNSIRWRERALETLD
jgi:glucoamylase